MPFVTCLNIGQDKKGATIVTIRQGPARIIIFLRADSSSVGRGLPHGRDRTIGTVTVLAEAN